MMKLPDDVDPQALLADLRARAVFADARGPLLRCSPGFVTTQAGVDRLAEAMGSLRRSSV
jgi:selenocysteine lyase/cysteine desulfurase